jgi:hypothetical protein
MRVLAYAALIVPLLSAAFVGGIVFERHRAQLSPLERPPPSRSATSSQGAPTPPAGELSREQKIRTAMQAIETAWRTAIERENLFAVRHSANCYSARFLRRGANLRADIKNAGTNGDVGIIRISGMTATTGKFACFKSFAEALAANKSAAEDVERVEATFSYVISGDEVRLERANSDPEWFARVLKYNLTDHPASWSAVAAQPI